MGGEPLGPHALLFKMAAAAARDVIYNYRKKRAMINSQVSAGARTLAKVTLNEPDIRTKALSAAF